MMLFDRNFGEYKAMANNLETRLAPLALALRGGQLDLNSYLEQLEAQFTPENERILAFLPEEGRFERLRHEAAELHARYPKPELRPPLYGVPIGVKDIFHAEGFPTHAGSQLPADVLTGPEAESVTQLKQAGALILGKAVTTEFAFFGPGPTRNPYNPEHTPGGSSSGSAAAVGAGICALALGTQTVGSIIRPASFCGTVGFKPTSGRISAKNVIPLSVTLDHIGFFTQDVVGATLAASVLVKDWREIPPPVEHPVLGVPAGPYLEKTSSEGLEHFQATQKKLEQAGFTIRTVEVMSNFDEIYNWHMDLMAADAAAFHQDWFAKFGDRYHPKTTALLERGQPISAEQIKSYKAEREKFKQELGTVMAEHNISLWISPSALGTAPAGLESTGDPVMNLPWTYAGLPVTNLPSGFGDKGLPLGLQVTAGWQQDEELLAWSDQITEALA